MNTPPPITPLEMSEQDIDRAVEAALRMGYEQTAYTSSSGLWGLFCINENPSMLPPKSKERHHPPYTKGCFIKTAEFGLMFVQDLDDLQAHDLADAERKAVAV